MRSEYSEITRVNTLGMQQKLPSSILYSAAEYAPVQLESHAIAQSIATGLCQQLDFPRLVNKLYADGARIFIETGAGNVCSRWIDKNLSDRPHLTVSLNRRGLDDHAGLVKALAKLISHQVDVDLSPLIAPELPTNKKAKFTQKKVILGGDSFIDKIVTEENKKLFHNIAKKVISSPQTKPNIPQVETKKKISIQDIPKPSKAPAATPQLLETATKSQPQLSKSAMLTTAISNIQPTDKQLHKNTSILHQTHKTFLQSRQEFSQQISQIIQLQIACAEKLLEEVKSQN